MSQTKAQLIDNLVSPITGALGSASAPTFSFTADPNTGLYSPGADQVAISTNGTGRLFVDASGNVGIGATPNSYAGYSTLTINNTSGSELDFEVNGTLTSDIYTDSTGTYWTTRTAVPIVLRTNSAERLRITSAGLVGVGTSAPGGNFHVSSSNAYFTSIDLENIASTGRRYTLFSTTSLSGIGGPGLHVYDATASASRLFIDSSGRLGIGTASPRSLLSFGTADTSGTNGINLYDNGGNYRTGIGATSSYLRLYTPSDGSLQLGRLSTSDGSTFLEAARIDSSGRLGIGATSDVGSSKVFIAGDSIAGLSNIVTLRTGPGNSYGLQIKGNHTSDDWSINNYYGGALTFGTNNAERVRITAGGAVGIGTTSPQSFVTINGGTGAGFTDVLQLSAGAAAANSGPGLSFNINYGDYDYFKTWQTGLIRSAAENTSNYQGYLAFYTNSGANATNISEKVRIDSSGRVGIGTTNPTDPNGFGNCIDIRSPTGAAIYLRDSDDTVNDAFIIGRDNSDSYLISASGNMLFLNNGSERARIDSSGRLLVGTSTARSNFYNSSVTSRVQIVGTGAGGSASQASLSLVNESANADEDSSLFLLGRSFGGNTLVTNNARLGTISFQGADGSELVEGASVSAFVDGTSGANDLPTRLVFSTTADGASSPTERMRIKNHGQIFTYADSVNAFAIATSGSTSATNACIYLQAGATGIDTGTITFRVQCNGDVDNTNNSYGAISDVKLKENIVDANSQWSDIKSSSPLHSSALQSVYTHQPAHD
jgi:hypothetical protein